MTDKTKKSTQERRFGSILRDDLSRGDFRQTMHRDYKELKDFFLDDDRKARLKRMNWFKRGLFTFGWLLKALFLKLTPARRLLLLLAAIIVFLPHNYQYSGEVVQLNIETSSFALLILLFILMLELKDKLLARDELEAGRAVQIALTPEQTPSIPGWSVWLFTRTANEVGGDLVDLQQLDTHRYRISLADVAGKGLTAALLAAKLQSTVRALSPDHTSLAELGTKLNRIFYRDSLRNFFASFACVEIETQSDAVRILNAGHFPPVHIMQSKSEETQKGDPAIGIFPEVTYGERQLTLGPGEMLLIYSDGVTEAKNETGEFFGIQRLTELLPRINGLNAEQAGEMIVANVDRFVSDARVYDDLSLVILQRLP